MLTDFGKFFTDNPQCNEIKSGPFTLWFNLKHKRLTDDQRALYGKVLKQIDRKVDPTIEAGLMERLVASATASKLTTLLEQYEDGEADLTAALRDLNDEHQSQLDRKVRLPEVTDDIDDLLEVDQHNVGLPWRLAALSDHMRSLQAGDFIVVAARPDAGKTTFIASEITHMAKHVDTLYPGEYRSILWLNNEGPGSRIKRRVHQAALGMTLSEMVALKERGDTKQAYAAAVGRADIIRIFNIHDYWSHEVEDILATIPSALVVFDMIDNIKFGGTMANGGQRTDQALEAMYQWARLMAVKYDTAAIATSQVSGDGDGELYPKMHMLKDSKTGKQGAAEAIIMLGKSNADELQNSRFISIPKNKLHLEGTNKTPQREVVFDADRARVIDPR